MRKSGILLHISSLPSAYGIGKMGASAYAFADFLEKSEVGVWQILPLSPTSYGDSPYQSFSVHAGNPYFIDFETLEQQDLLLPKEYKTISWGSDPRRVDYACIYQNCFAVLRKAFARFDQQQPAYQQFCKEQADWLPDYALFMALKQAHGGASWDQWEKPLVMRQPKALAEAKKTYQEDIAFYSVMQFWFQQQWFALKQYCNQKGISIVGDMPIYVAYDSVEVWSMPELFCLDAERVPIEVAGCPPDAFSPTGQLWGNPLYQWDYHKKTHYAWWVRRMQRATQLYDIVRIDHFRGFESYYTIPYGNETAEIGQWRKGPDYALFEALQKELGDLPVLAEDLGFVTPEVQKLLDRCGYPGMKVLQFAFDSDSSNSYLPHNYTTSNCVAYTGTHDNMTLRGWLADASKRELRFAKKYLRCKEKHDVPAEMVRAAWSSVAELAVAQMQDFLESPACARMNTPSTSGGNWQYRTQKEDFTKKLAKKIRKLNELYNRCRSTALQQKTEKEILAQEPEPTPKSDEKPTPSDTKPSAKPAVSKGANKDE